MAAGKFLSLIERYLQGTPPDLDERLARLIAERPTPVVWLLGKTQAGKSSIVRTVTGLTGVEIGEGFKPCTRSAQRYAFPDEEHPLLYFLDTRGLLEAGYDAAEDIAFCEQHAHLLLVVVKATDQALEGLLAQLKKITKRHPEWPVILVQTSLHEAYPPGTPHPESHELLDAHPPELPSDYHALHELLERQRALFAPFVSGAVAVDFTLPEDGYAPAEFGRERLLQLLDVHLPEVAWNFIRAEHRAGISFAYLKRAQPHIAFYSTLCAAAAASPLPFADIPLITGIQLKMMHSIAGVYSQRLNYERIAEVAGAVGLSYLSRLGWRAVAKLVPGGSIAYAAYSGAVTFALGNALCAYFDFLRAGATPDRDTLRRIFQESMHTAQQERWR